MCKQTQMHHLGPTWKKFHVSLYCVEIPASTVPAKPLSPVCRMSRVAVPPLGGDGDGSGGLATGGLATGGLGTGGLLAGGGGLLAGGGGLLAGGGGLQQQQGSSRQISGTATARHG